MLNSEPRLPTDLEVWCSKALDNCSFSRVFSSFIVFTCDEEEMVNLMVKIDPPHAKAKGE